MGKNRCDPIDTSATLAALAECGAGLIGPRRDAGVLRRLYADYASVAARPYARASWEMALRAEQRRLAGRQHIKKSLYATIQELECIPSQLSRKLAGSGSEQKDNGRDKCSLDPHLDAAPVKPSNILTLSSDAPMLYVRGDCLHCKDDNLILKYERRGQKPYGIVLAGWGGRITIGAIRFCAENDIEIIILDWDRGLMSVALTPAARAEPTLRAQVNADKLSVSRSIISAKATAHFNVGAMDQTKASQWLARIKSATDIPSLTMTEALAAKQAWGSRDVIMRWREAGLIPPSWKHPWNKRRSVGRRATRGSAYKAKDHAVEEITRFSDGSISLFPSVRRTNSTDNAGFQNHELGPVVRLGSRDVATWIMICANALALSSRFAATFAFLLAYSASKPAPARTLSRCW
jgi:hypothetical protein